MTLKFTVMVRKVPNVWLDHCNGAAPGEERIHPRRHILTNYSQQADANCVSRASHSRMFSFPNEPEVYADAGFI